MAIMNEMPGYKPARDKKTKEGSFGKRFVRSFIPMKGDSKGEVIRKIVFIVAVIVLVISLFKLYTYFFGDPGVEKLNEEIREEYSSSSDGTGSENEKDKYLPNGMLSKFESLYNKNNDLIGWIEIADTKISYPVMQTTDNSYYLTHDFEKKESKSGAIYADSKGVVSKDSRPDSIVLYGHSMKSGEFFHDVLEYKNIDFFKEHMTISFDTLYEENTYKVFACFLTGGNASQDNGNFFIYHCMQNFDSEQEFNEFYSELMNRTYFNTDVDVQYGDELLMLSTCSYEYSDSRFVLVARKVRDGESSDVDAASVTVNSDRYMTQEWHDIYG